jgi:hypothetical protein
MNTENEQNIVKVKGEINEFMSQFTLYPNWKI